MSDKSDIAAERDLFSVDYVLNYYIKYKSFGRSGLLGSCFVCRVVLHIQTFRTNVPASSSRVGRSYKDMLNYALHSVSKQKTRILENWRCVSLKVRTEFLQKNISI
jgi:hypothetical protein